MAKTKQFQEKAEQPSARKQIEEKLTKDFGDIKKAIGDKSLQNV